MVDRASRRTVLMACDLARAVAVGIAAWLALAHELRFQHLYVLQAALGFSSAFFQPALRAIAPQLLPPTLLPSANALRSSARDRRPPGPQNSSKESLRALRVRA